MRKKQIPIKMIKQLATLVALAIIFIIATIPVLATDAQLILDVNIVDPASGPLETGQIVEYVIDFSCASITDPCGDLNIDFPLDIELEFIEVISPPGYIGSTYTWH